MMLLSLTCLINNLSPCFFVLLLSMWSFVWGLSVKDALAFPSNCFSRFLLMQSIPFSSRKQHTTSRLLVSSTELRKMCSNC